MLKYILILLTGSMFLSAQKIKISDAQIEKMVLAHLEPSAVKQMPEHLHKTVSKPLFYVQMGAFQRHKPHTLIHKLERIGYHPLLKSTVRNSEKYTLVLIGPYRSRGKAERSLKILRAVEPAAFIYTR